MFLLPGGATVTASIVTAVNTYNTDDTGGGTAHTESSKSVGAVSGRTNVVVALSLDQGAANSRPVTSMTIGGNTASLVATSAGDSERTEMWEYPLTSGTTATIVINFSSNVDSMGISIYALYNSATSSTATDGEVTTANPHSFSLTCPAGGVILCHGMVNGGSVSENTVTFGGTDALTEDYDSDRSGSNQVWHSGSRVFADAGTKAFTVTAAAYSTSSGLAASWAVAS